MPVPPSSHAALAGAEVLLNLSASNITIGKAEMRRLLCGSQSARAIAAYAYSASGPGESTTDLAWDGHAAIFECGDQLAETERFAKDSTIVTADVDLGRIRQERLRNNSFGDCACCEGDRVARFRTRRLRVRRAGRAAWRSSAPVERFPYVPSDPAKLRDNCYEAYNIQVQGLAQRLQSSRVEKRGHRRVGRPRFDAGADRRLPRDGPARPAAHEHPGLHAAGLRHLRQDAQAMPGS